jgi:hypothetical protein
LERNTLELLQKPSASFSALLNATRPIKSCTIKLFIASALTTQMPRFADVLTTVLQTYGYALLMSSNREAARNGKLYVEPQAIQEELLGWSQKLRGTWK